MCIIYLYEFSFISVGSSIESINSISSNEGNVILTEAQYENILQRLSNLELTCEKQKKALEKELAVRESISLRVKERRKERTTKQLASSEWEHFSREIIQEAVEKKWPTLLYDISVRAEASYEEMMFWAIDNKFCGLYEIFDRKIHNLVKTGVYHRTTTSVHLDEGEDVSDIEGEYSKSLQL